MSETVLIRHTRLTGTDGLCYGRWEAGLADTFETEAEAVRRALPWTPAVVWTSPAERCRRLAERLAAGAVVRVDERLHELAFGAWEGRRWEEFHGPESEAWAQDPWTRRPPGGESAADLWARVAAVRAAWLARPEARLAIVTHAGVIRAWRALAQGADWREAGDWPVAFGAVVPAS